MKSVKSFWMFTAFVAAWALAASTTAVQAEETIKLRLGSGHPAKVLEANIITTSWYVPELIRRVKAKTGKTLVVQQLHGGTVAKVKEVLEATRDGLLDIGSWYFVFEPTNAFLQAMTFYIPFNTPDPEQVTVAMRRTFKAFPELGGVYEKKFNQKLLSVSCTGNYGLGTSFPWTKFSQLKGHKIAGAGANLSWIAGATPVSSNLNEAYNAMQTGVYEGYIIFAGAWYSFKLHEVAKYFMETDFGSMAAHAMTINLNTWNKLGKDVQAVFLEMAPEFEKRNWELCKKFTTDSRAKLLKAGATINKLAPEEKTRWCEAVKGVPNKFAQDANSRGLPGTKAFRYYFKALEDLGYKFPCEYEIE